MGREVKQFVVLVTAHMPPSAPLWLRLVSSVYHLVTEEEREEEEHGGGIGDVRTEALGVNGRGRWEKPRRRILCDELWTCRDDESQPADAGQHVHH
ncbi:hypothetical protein EYF80_044313 [Liparis tanakae]|uniref:Uncharacterized protein n=1 Tax=Liparis tanakae TaxID=230148 RepID=A0A4Z2FW75_9TELE|nr:hypothetical protein EYF80_044313 [Liparis tanakae]